MESTLKGILWMVYRFLEEDFQYPKASTIKCDVSFWPNSDRFGQTILLIEFREMYKFDQIGKIVKRFFKLNATYHEVRFWWEFDGHMDGAGQCPKIRLNCSVAENPPQLKTKVEQDIHIGKTYSLLRFVGTEED